MNVNILVETEGLSHEEWLRWRKKGKKQEASNHLKEIMGDYDKASCMGHSISWKPVTSERLDTKALKEKEPDIYAKYAKSSTSRRFTIK
jgi:predicted phage-related endonuclease